MYMNHPPHVVPSRRPPEFKLPSFEEDEKLVFVDSVCATLMTSRFGNGATYTLIPRFEGTTADEPISFLDLMEDVGIGWHDAAAFVGRGSLGLASSDDREQNQLEVTASDATRGRSVNTLKAISPSNLGRGSPEDLWDVLSSLRLPLRP